MVGFIKQRNGNIKLLGSRESNKRFADFVQGEKKRWDNLTPDQQQKEHEAHIASTSRVKQIAADRREARWISPELYYRPVDC